MTQHDRRDGAAHREPEANKSEAADARPERGLEAFARRAVEAGVQRMLNSDEGLRNLVGAVVPRELVGRAVDQVDAAKTEVVAVVGREMRTFLANLNVGDELAKILTSVSFEVRMQVRFVPNEDGTLRAQVRAEPVTAVATGPMEPEAKGGGKMRRGLRAVAEQAVRAAAGAANSAAQGSVSSSAVGTYPGHGGGVVAPSANSPAANSPAANSPTTSSPTTSSAATNGPTTNSQASAASGQAAPVPAASTPMPGKAPAGGAPGYATSPEDEDGEASELRAGLRRHHKLVSGMVGRLAEATAVATRVAAEVAADAAAEVVNRSRGGDRTGGRDDDEDDEGDELDAY